MIFSDNGIVLLRQDFRENDRVVCLYTREHGRINVRFPGVLRAQSKLKAMSEPFTCAEYRLYVRGGSTIGTATGGKIRSVFPAVRRDLRRSTLALHFCELVYRLTPMHQPNAEKFELLLSALTELEYGEINAAFAPAFTLRLMTLAGFGLDHPVLKIDNAFWKKMHEDKLSSLKFSSPQDLLNLSKCNSVCSRFLDRYLTYPLHTAKYIGLEQETATWSPLPEAVPA
jgi:DNA repair protein RecO (recombination protein O)